MRSVWLALLNSLQQNIVILFLHHHEIRNANQATVRAHAPHNLRYVKCRLRFKVAVKPRWHFYLVHFVAKSKMCAGQVHHTFATYRRASRTIFILAAKKPRTN